MNKKLLIIALVWPEPTSTAAGNRMAQLIDFFLEEAYQITIASTATETQFSMDIDSLGITKASIQLNHSSFDQFIAKLSPEIVLFDRFLAEEQFGWRVAKFAPNALRILDTEDLHSLRKTREICFKKGHNFTTDLWLQQDITKREMASIYRTDVSLIISSYEMQLLIETAKIDERLLLYLPFMINMPSKEEIKTLKPFEERSDFICIGNGKHAPNVDAFVRLKTEIWPLIRKELPKTDLHIYGAYLPQHLKQMHNEKEGFLIKGWAPNVKNAMGSAKVNLAPLRFGAGLKGKLLDAMRFGTPNVTTVIGAEGMLGAMNFAGIIADDSRTFAEAAIKLYRSQALWREKQNCGFDALNKCFDKNKWIQKLGTRLKTVQGKLKIHRTQNLIGAMLQHQTMASSMYLSKWIQEKNG